MIIVMEDVLLWLWRLIGWTTLKHNYIYCIQQYFVYIFVRVSGQDKHHLAL